MLVRLFHITMSLFLLTILAGCANRGPEQHQLSLVERLRSQPFEYHDDGAGDDSIVQMATAMEGPTGNSAIIAELVDHLQDCRDTRATLSSGGKKTVVPVAYLCLDLLCFHFFAADNNVRISEFGDDGLGAGVRDTFYFRPDVLEAPNGIDQVRRVAQRWTEYVRSSPGETHGER